MNESTAGREGSNEREKSAGQGGYSFPAILLPFLSVATPLAAPITWHYSPLATLGSMAASHAALCYASLRANCQWFGPVATRFLPKGNEVWLTIDDGPCPEDTPKILDLLDAASARATFFVRGDQAEKYPELIGEIVRRGNGVANHTYTHPQFSFWCSTPWRIAAEMERCNTVLRELIGQPPRWFRAPVGMVNPFVHRAAFARGMRVVGWSQRGFDTLKNASPERIVTRILHRLRPGEIVLLHEGRRSESGERINVKAAQLLLAALAGRSWRAVIPDDTQLI